MKEGDGSVVNKDWLRKDLYVYDVIYHRETQLLKDAKTAGVTFKDGLGMLLYQGKAAFEHWIPDIEAPVEVMRQALQEEIERCRI